MKCPSCGNPLAHDADVRRVYCSQVCRSAAFRAREVIRRDAEAAFRTAAEDLLMRQTRAVIANDTDALAQVARDAADLFA